MIPFIGWSKRDIEVPSHLIPPHGGELIELIVAETRISELTEDSRDWPSHDLNPRQLCDVELLLSGGFSPLTGFMGKADYESVRDQMRLADGTLFPLPICLDISAEEAEGLEAGSRLALRDAEGVMLAVLQVEEIWEPDRNEEAEKVYGTTSTEHPGVDYLLNRGGAFYVVGRLEGIRLPVHYDFRRDRHTPRQLREEFARLGWRKVVAYQPGGIMHRSHVELTLRAAKEVEANLLIHPVVGGTNNHNGNPDHFTRVRCYEAILARYPQFTARLSLLNLAVRFAGPRETLLKAIVRKNHGCTHVMVGRDDSGPGADSQGEPFYEPYEALELLREYAEELGVGLVLSMRMAYVEEEDAYMPRDEVPEGLTIKAIPRSELRARLEDGRDIPRWFTYPEVLNELRRTHPPRHKQGLTVFFTGLSGSGKSTAAKVLLVKLLQMGERSVTLLDGDIVRKNLSSELGFSKEHRDLNIRRIGFVASEITKGGGIALCAPIAPYDAIRQANRAQISQHGGFILVYVSTPLEVCEARDRKGLYAKAREGVIKEFTGISDPYEVPEDADVVIDTTDITPEEAAQLIFLHLEKEGYVGPPPHSA